ncbi:MAG: hypothetical protein HY918_02220 [Candidatus Doudnabacteria bacterium]|nr:hypothetical protein [Candidatus Doudnabacteria bacterium]
MTSEQIKKATSSYRWEPWLKRPFFGFIMSTFKDGNTKKAFNKIGLPGWQCDFLFSNGEWFKSDKSYAKAKPIVLKWFKTHSVKEISERLETSHKLWVTKVTELAKNASKDNVNKLKFLDNILREITTYVWAVHTAEHFFTPLLKNRVSKIVKGDLEKFIGDASFPVKHNSLEQMIEDYKRGISKGVLAKKYGWMRARDGFSPAYSASELIDIAKHALAQEKHKHPAIPEPLEKIIKEARELVYLRMLRMDVYYEIMNLAKPLLQIPAKKFGIPYQDLKYYTLSSLIKGKPKYYPPEFSCVSINEKFYYLNEPIFLEKDNSKINEIKGRVAQNGIITGKAKILMTVKELSKIKKGDILITYMTSPNFLPAMKLAAGFVTDEGGLTCHAAIVAREMKKPCIIGTKIATKVFKDGDLVEVNANTGIVKLIKRK